MQTCFSFFFCIFFFYFSLFLNWGGKLLYNFCSKASFISLNRIFRFYPRYLSVPKQRYNFYKHFIGKKFILERTKKKKYRIEIEMHAFNWYFCYFSFYNIRLLLHFYGKKILYLQMISTNTILLVLILIF